MESPYLQRLDEIIATLKKSTNNAKALRRRIVKRQTSLPMRRADCDCSTEEAAALAAMQVAATEQTEADVALTAASAADLVWQTCLADC